MKKHEKLIVTVGVVGLGLYVLHMMSAHQGTAIWPLGAAGRAG